MKNSNKKMRRVIRWERVVMVMMIIFNIYQLCSHIALNGLYGMLIIEVVEQILLTTMVTYTIKDMRKKDFEIF